jgi:thioredoxin reductase (NADPH)
MAALNLHPTAFQKIEAACPELDQEQIATLAQFATSRQFKAGEMLLAAGEQELKLFVVKSGELEVRENSSGAVVTVLGPRQFTGDVDLLAGRPSAVSVIAKTDCDTYELSAEALKKILREMPRLSDLLLRAFLMREN